MIDRNTHNVSSSFQENITILETEQHDDDISVN